MMVITHKQRRKVVESIGVMCSAAARLFGGAALKLNKKSRPMTGAHRQFAELAAVCASTF
jgi:hypothetical protein